MKLRTPLTLLAAAAALVGMMVAWRGAVRTRSAEAATINLLRERDRVEATIRALRAKLGVAGRLRADAYEGRGPGAQAPAGTDSRFAELAERWTSSNPRNQAATVKHYQAGLPLDYYPLYRANGWSGERIAKFERAMTDHFGRIADLETTARESRLPPKDPIVAKLRRDEDERFVDALREAIGEEERQRFIAFQSEATLRRVVSQMIGALIVTANPLEPAQVQQLTETFRANGFARDGGERAVKELTYARHGHHLESGDRVGWEAVLAQARTFLSPVQFAELENQAAPTLQSRDAMAELQRLIEAEAKAKVEAAVTAGR